MSNYRQRVHEFILTSRKVLELDDLSGEEMEVISTEIEHIDDNLGKKRPHLHS